MLGKDNKKGIKDNKKGIKEWAKNLKHNEEFAKKYEGLTTVEGILATARKDGYDIKKEELMEFDLDSVAGGAGTTADKDGSSSSGAGTNTSTSATIDTTVKHLAYTNSATDGSEISNSVNINM